MDALTAWLLVLGVWGIVGILGAFYIYLIVGTRVEGSPMAPEPNLVKREMDRVAQQGARPLVDAPLQSTRRHAVTTPEPELEGWGPPDSDVVTPDGDDYLARMRRPRSA